LRLRDANPDPESTPQADGAIALRLDGCGQTPAVRTADCVPVLIVERTGRAVAAVHAGWRGTAAGIARRAVERLAGAGIPPDRLRVGLGPAVGPCCYEVSQEVVSRVCQASEVAVGRVTRPGPRERPMLDLPGAVAAQLRAAGVSRTAISVAPWCTSCHVDLFFSYRRDGSRTGRMMALVGWTADRSGKTPDPRREARRLTHTPP
jgi:YfiH family protein